MNTSLLKRIHTKLLDIDSSLEIVKDDFKKYDIDIEYFLDVIKFYIINFEKLKNFTDETYLDLLNDKLQNILIYYKDIELFNVGLKSSINFIEKHQKTFFNLEQKEKIKSTINLDKFSYLDAVKIKNYFTIKEIELTDLKDKKEIYFVGGNGDGKTILLQAIVLALKKDYPGQVIEYIRDIRDNLELLAKDEYTQEYSDSINRKNVFAYGINRNKVREKYDKYGYSGLFDTSDFKDTTFLKNPIEVLSSSESIIKDFIDKLNKYILKESIKIELKNKKVLIKENNVEVEFDKLSEGYKSTLIWVCDLVSRLIENDNNKTRSVSDFKAIVLIDEIDLYLHPTWKYDYVYSLRKVFPNIQFLMITHSMVTILGASEDALFYKVYKDNGETKVSQPISSIKNLMANTLSTSPLFDMNTARARNSNDEIDTSEDYIYSKVHKAIANRVKNKKVVIEDEIEQMINDELDKLLNEH